MQNVQDRANIHERIHPGNWKPVARNIINKCCQHPSTFIEHPLEIYQPVVARNASKIKPIFCKHRRHPIKTSSQINQNDDTERSESDLGSKPVPDYLKGATAFRK